MSNYLDTSDFGMVAGSLLARKKRIKNRDRNEALILSAILAGINKENQNQQEELASAIANIDVDFKLETARNQELYNNTNIKKQREMYQLYQNEDTKQRAINEKALEMFNAAYTGEIPVALGTAETPYSKIYKVSEETGNKEQLEELSKELDEFKVQAEEYYKKLQVPEIITPTFVDFNRDAVQAYKNSLERVKDDPELQGAIRKIFYNIFQKKTDDNRVPISAIYKDELKNISEINSQFGTSAPVTTSDIVKAEDLIKFDLRKSKDTTPIAAHVSALNTALNPAKRKESVLNTIEFEYDGTTGTVFKHYNSLTGEEKLSFQNRVYKYSRILKERADKQNVEGNVFSAEYFLEEAIRETFLEDTFKNNLNTNATGLFNPDIEITDFNLDGDITNVTQGKLFDTLQELFKVKNEYLVAAEEKRILIGEIQSQLEGKPEHEDFLNVVINSFVTSKRKTRKDSRR